jgi:hypothetical protein
MVRNLSTYTIQFQIEPETSIKVKTQIKNSLREVTKEILNHSFFETNIPIKTSEWDPLVKEGVLTFEQLPAPKKIKHEILFAIIRILQIKLTRRQQNLVSINIEWSNNKTTLYAYVRSTAVKIINGELQAT